MNLTALILLLASALCVSAQPVTLAWDNTNSARVSYVLKWGVTNNAVTNIVVAGTNATAELTNGPWGRVIIAAVAVSTNGVESNPSNLVTVTNTPSAPLRLRVTTVPQAVQLEGTFNGGSSWRTLAIVTNEPALILGAMQGMMFRASKIKPPPLP